MNISKTAVVGFLYAVALLAMLAPRLSQAAGSDAPTKRVRADGVSREIVNGQKKLSTSMRFSASRVGGQYQIPSEATARIENEKPIEELLGLRTQFRDRMKLDEERNSERE